MSAPRRFLSFEDAADRLRCKPEDVRVMVVEEKQLRALYVTHMGFSEPYGLQVIRVDEGGKAFDLTSDLAPHSGYLRIEKSCLEEFISAILPKPTAVVETEKPLTVKERNTLLTIIAVLCKEAKLDYKKPAKTAGLIKDMAAAMPVSIGETTIENHLKKIPDALGTRTR